jgi:hypothetical protein
VKEELGPELIKRLIVAVAMAILFGLIIIFSPWVLCESLIQVIGLLVLLGFSINKEISPKGILKLRIGSAFVFSVVSNSVIWVVYPSSKVAELIDLITFLFFNNSIFFLGVSISLLAFAFKFKSN